MPDDPDKRGPQDRSRVSQQEHEQRYQKKKREQLGKPHEPNDSKEPEKSK